ncbi:MAG: YggS family pyridoxal phosphate-dependent enzyme [Dehalococcoidia bacterium]|nr:YggS family pyridoxal phosphate-dependent enzyme [Dehalococcoidia bacterium]
MSGHSDSGIKARVRTVRERIAAACERAGRDPAGVTLIAASKTQGPGAVAAAWRAGIRDFGENRVQEALAKMPLVEALTGAGLDGPRWHLIGHLQRNKAKAAAGAFVILHGVDSARLVDTLAGSGHATRILFEVNVAGEATKHGASPEELDALIAHAARYPTISVEGLMTVAPLATDPEDVRPVFRALRLLAEAHNLSTLSMGMTNDFEVAIEEGATHVRVGRAIFGVRA